MTEVRYKGPRGKRVVIASERPEPRAEQRRAAPIAMTMHRAAKGPPKQSPTDLRRVANEFKSERDAAKRDTLRAVDERNVLISQNAKLRKATRTKEIKRLSPSLSTDERVARLVEIGRKRGAAVLREEIVTHERKVADLHAALLRLDIEE